MITKKALRKARVLAFWEKHGLQAAMEAFGFKRRTLFLWKRKLKEAEGKFEGLNEKKTTPKIKRKRIWPLEILAEIKRLRWQHPNLGKEKLSPELKEFCDNKGLKCPQPRTIGRLIKDLGGLRIYPQRISHFGRIKPIKRQKVLRKPKDFQAEHLRLGNDQPRLLGGCRVLRSLPPSLSFLFRLYVRLNRQRFGIQETLFRRFEKTAFNSLSHLSQDPQDERSSGTIQPHFALCRKSLLIITWPTCSFRRSSTASWPSIFSGTTSNEFISLSKTNFLRYNSCHHYQLTDCPKSAKWVASYMGLTKKITCVYYWHGSSLRIEKIKIISYLHLF